MRVSTALLGRQTTVLIDASILEASLVILDDDIVLACSICQISNFLFIRNL